MLQHTAPMFCSFLSLVPLDETFWPLQVRIVKIVHSRSAKAFETLKRRALWCFLVLFTSDGFAKKQRQKTELVFSQSQSLRRLCRCFSSTTDDIHFVQLHVTWWDCAYLNVFAASFLLCVHRALSKVSAFLCSNGNRRSSTEVTF